MNDDRDHNRQTTRSVGLVAIVASTLWILLCIALRWWSEIGLGVLFFVLGVACLVSVRAPPR